MKIDMPNQMPIHSIFKATREIMIRKTILSIAFGISMLLLGGQAFTQETPTLARPLLPPPPEKTSPASTTTDKTQQVVQVPLQNNLGQNPPAIYRVEAYAGQPFGIGLINYRLNPGDDMIDRSGAALLTEANNRILYPVTSKPAAAKFFQAITGNRPDEPESLHSIWFLFKGEQPLNVQLHGNGTVNRIVPVEFARKQRKFDRLLNQWWNQYNEVADQSADWGDYPPMIETYLTSMLSSRLALPLPGSRQKSQDPLIKTLNLLFDVESLRADTIRQTMTGMIDTAQISQPLPKSARWSDLDIKLKQDPKIEPIARCVPKECFYLRFGTWQNQLWLKRLIEEFGGDLGRMVSLRGYSSRVQSKFLNQLAIQSTEFDELFGGKLISDVAVIGTDMYFNDGGAVGVLLHAKNSDFLKRNLIAKREKFRGDEKGLEIKIEDVEVSGRSVHFLHTADNRYRSFYIVDGDDHLICTSLQIVKRFIAASEGRGQLINSNEFRYARQQMPLDRDDTVFLFTSSDFFQNLLGPQYQIELARRNRTISDIQLVQLASMAAVNEGIDPSDVKNLIAQGFLPKQFGTRPDRSQLNRKGNDWYDSIRGRRGFFTPIPDVKITGVTNNEAVWYSERTRYFSQSMSRMDPMLVAIKRYEQTTEKVAATPTENDDETDEENQKDTGGAKSIERVVFDARVAPFGQEKYSWLLSMLGPPLTRKVAESPRDAIRFEASLQSGLVGANVPPHQLFGAIQDDQPLQPDLRPASFFRMLDMLRSAPGYVGSWPNAGYINWMPKLGGAPDLAGYTYSKMLKLWRLQWNGFSVVAFDQHRLEQLKPHLQIVENDRPTHLQLDVSDLTRSNLRGWANMQNYKRSWQTSIANTRLLNMLTQQFRVDPKIARKSAEDLLDVNLVCSLGGEYQLQDNGAGRLVWNSTAWPNFSAPTLPPGYTAPLLKWFRGLKLQVAKTDSQFLVHGYLDIQRDQESKLPSFNLFKGFGNLFGGDKKAAEEEKAQEKNEK